MSLFLAPADKYQVKTATGADYPENLFWEGSMLTIMGDSLHTLLAQRTFEKNDFSLLDQSGEGSLKSIWAEVGSPDEESGMPFLIQSPDGLQFFFFPEKIHSGLALNRTLPIPIK